MGGFAFLVSVVMALNYYFKSIHEKEERLWIVYSIFAEIWSATSVIIAVWWSKN